MNLLNKGVIYHLQTLGKYPHYVKYCTNLGAFHSGDHKGHSGAFLQVSRALGSLL